MRKRIFFAVLAVLFSGLNPALLGTDSFCVFITTQQLYHSSDVVFTGVVESQELDTFVQPRIVWKGGSRGNDVKLQRAPLLKQGVEYLIFAASSEGDSFKVAECAEIWEVNSVAGQRRIKDLNTLYHPVWWALPKKK